MSEPAVPRPDPMRKLRCSECGKRHPAAETTLISALVGGNYRSAARHGQIRVCRVCTTDRVDYVRRSQTQGLGVPLNSGRISWQQAANFFKIDISGLSIYRMGDQDSS